MEQVPRAVITARRIVGGLLLLSAVAVVAAFSFGALTLANRPVTPVPLPQTVSLQTGQTTSVSSSSVSSSVRTSERVVSNPTLLIPASVVAEETAGDSVDDANQPVSYGSANLFDGNSNTAWRAPGDATGLRIAVDLGFDAHITSVGLIPGYAKIDATTGANRFPENRRVTSASWQTDRQSAVTQTFLDQPIVQSVPTSLDGRFVTLTIKGVTPHGGRDFTAISEIQIYGG